MKLNIPEFSVSEFSSSIKRVVEDAFGYVRIKGEITGFKRAASGHLYFTLKDENATLSSVCFRNAARGIDFEVADGLEVIASGRVTTYEGRSNYQIIIEKIEIAGIGAILEMIEKRRLKLMAEGLFDDIHKKPIPFMSKTIGIITSATGAVIEDIKHRISARFGTHLLLYPATVQGNKAATEVISGIKYFNRLKASEKPDLLIIARGGGSFEDLLVFNDEALVRQVFLSDIPIISAIGHETDTTLIDYVSDLRAPTPSAAAELATPILSELKAKIDFLGEKLISLPQEILLRRSRELDNVQRYISDPRVMLEGINKSFLSLNSSLKHLSDVVLENKKHKLRAINISTDFLRQKIITTSQNVEFLFQQIDSMVVSYIKEESGSLLNLAKLLQSNHYDQVLKRGFALIKDNKGNLISSVQEAKTNKELLVEMHDGNLRVETSSKIIAQAMK